MKAIFALCLVFCIVLSANAALKDSHTAEVDQLLALLKKMEQKIRNAERSNDAKLGQMRHSLKTERKTVATLAKKEAALATMASKMRVKNNGELALIQKIRNMLVFDYGTAEHPAASCAEALSHRAVASGTFYVLKDGTPTKVLCAAQVFKKSSVEMWKGGCPSHQNSNGWAHVCSSGTRFKSENFDEYIGNQKSGTFKVVHPGWYRISAWAMPNHGGWCHSQMQLLSKYGFSPLHSHHHSWRTMMFDNYLPFTGSDEFHFRMHSCGGGNYRTTHNWGNNYNGYEIEYMGKNMRSLMTSCNPHGRNPNWQQYCMDRTVFNGAKGFLSHTKAGVITVLQPGFIDVHATIMQHGGNCQRRVRLYINGDVADYGYSQANGGWSQTHVQNVYAVRKGDKIRLEAAVDCGNRYNWHAWAYSFVQVTHRGADLPVMSYSCNNSPKGAGNWKAYCGNIINFNTLQQYVGFDQGSGKITFKVPGVYKINSMITSKINSKRGWRHNRIHCNRGGNLFFSHHYEEGWYSAPAVATVVVKKNDYCQVLSHIQHQGSFFAAGSDMGHATVEYLGDLAK